MSAIQADIDPKGFQLWEDAFSYPIPVVRKLEQQLRSDISGNRERLRTLVGTSYRELLGTADSIIQMDKQMGLAEEYLSNISLKCNTRHLDKAKFNGARLVKQYQIRGTQQNASASHLAVLQMCPRVLVALIKSGSPLQLIAKILVLSRHLHKRALLDPSSVSFVNVLRLRLGKLRLKLLSVVDKRLANTTLTGEAIIDGLIAYSLVTNSSCADILRHFLHIRLSTISISSPHGDLHARALSGLKLWMRTVQDTQSLFPRQVSNALGRIKHTPLLQDEGIINLQEFDLDIHEPFLDDDIRHFIPYVRHDDLNVEAAARLLSSWSSAALKAYVDVLGAFLDRVTSFRQLLEIRQECLQLWMSSQGRTVGITKSECLDILRKVFQKQLLKCIDDQATSIQGVIEIAEKSLSNSEFSLSFVDSLWSVDLVQLELTDGANQLTNRIRDRTRGSSVLQHEIIHVYTEWLTKMKLVRTLLLDLKSTKWMADEFDDQEDDLDDLEDMRYRLEKEDPAELEAKLQMSLTASMESLEHGLDNQHCKLTNEPRAAEKAVFILRLAREMRQITQDKIGSHDASFSFITSLQKLIARSVVDKLISRHKTFIIAAMSQTQTPGRSLWDGEPESPVIPTPWPFRMLKSLHEDMAAIGFDIWTSSAVAKLQETLRDAIADILRTTATDKAEERAVQSSDLSNSGIGSTPSKLPDKTDAKIQLLFDVLYLETAISTHLEEGKKDDALGKSCATVAEETGLSIEASDRIRTCAIDYWKRTSLLFGLLA